MQDSAVLTFLFTDIEGSTSKWEEQPEQMAQAVGAPRRAAARRRPGPSADASSRRPATASTRRSRRRPTALAAVIDIQLALLDPAATAGLALRVRCGAAHRRRAGARQRLFRQHDQSHGADHERRARRPDPRLAGGRRAAARIDCPGDVALEGSRRRAPEGPGDAGGVFQVVHPKLYQNFPALRELEATPNNLPQQLTSFIGRERERDGDRGDARAARGC